MLFLFLLLLSGSFWLEHAELAQRREKEGVVLAQQGVDAHGLCRGYVLLRVVDEERLGSRKSIVLKGGEVSQYEAEE
jgi:hypothetical protein